ncbi:acyltransferase [Skermania sp. ID1734]|uniref:acyltransferase family protein n=1 Tax=Skermania sp. ID1734 TaxID=2597516 RepID=UPI00163DCC05|nr:acyltransferase [Skermania sp. ID1734]
MSESTATIPRRRLSSLQVGRGLAALAVVAFHVNDTMAKSKYFGHGPAGIFRAGDSGVNYFFVLSGFVILIAHWSDFQKGDAVSLFAWKRFRRIYPLLWFVLVCLCALFIVVPSLRSDAQVGFGAVVSAFLTLPAKHEVFLFVEWTLRHELLFYIAFAIALWRLRVGVLIAIIWTTLSVVQMVTDWPYPASFFLTPFHFLFAFGMIAAIAYIRNIHVAPVSILITGAVGFAACWLLVVFADIPSGSASIIIGRGVGAVLIVYGSAVLESRGALKFPRSLLVLGDASYALYLVHFPVVSVLTKIAFYVHQRIAYPPVLAVPIMITIATVVGVGAHFSIEKPMLSRLNGRPWRASRRVASKRQCELAHTSCSSTNPEHRG